MDPGNWQKTKYAVCVEGRLALKISGIEDVSHIIPNRVRCMKNSWWSLVYELKSNFLEECDLDDFYVVDNCTDSDVDCEKVYHLYRLIVK